MIRHLTRFALAVLIATGFSACSTTPDLPASFINPLNRLTAEEGQELVVEGDRLVGVADDDIARGKTLVRDGRQRRKEGEAIAARGRLALRAAAMAEEAERLSLKAAELKREALP